LFGSALARQPVYRSKVEPIRLSQYIEKYNFAVGPAVSQINGETDFRN
jgi:hypothetical protein